MITELRKVDPQIVGGHIIDVNELQIRNYRLHQVCVHLSRLFLFLLECDSNNSNSKAKPQDVRKILQQYAAVSMELKFAMDHNDDPDQSHELAFTVNVIDQKEISRVRNVKIQRILSEAWMCLHVIASLDSANLQGAIALEDYAKIEVKLNTVKDCMDIWIGDGSSWENTGIQIPAFENLGKVVPAINNNWAQTMEPGKGMPLPKYSDAPDTDLNTDAEYNAPAKASTY